MTDGCCWAADRDAGPILPVRNRIDPSGRGCQGPAVDRGSSLPAFVLAGLLIFRRAALRGWRGAVPTVLGLESGLYLWALFAGAGGALVAASEIA